MKRQVSREQRNEILDYVTSWRHKTHIKLGSMLDWLDMPSSKFYNWQKRRHLDTQHNGHIPKLIWLLDWEIAEIATYCREHMDEGYRRLAYMMLDENIVAISPSSVYRVLKRYKLLLTVWRHEKNKGSSFYQPNRPHQHWHLDISYINFKDTFVFLAALIDGCSRFLVHYEIKPSFEALDIKIMMERALKISG